MLAEDTVAGEDLVYYGGNNGGPSQVLAWGDGFVSFSKVWIPSLPLRLNADSGAELPPDLDEVELHEFLDQADRLDLDQLKWYTDNLVGTYQARAQVSPDGETWTDMENFSLPYGQYRFEMLSDGTHLVSVHRTYDRATGQIADLVVSVTTDLITWISSVLPVAPRLGSADTQTTVGGFRVALGPDGWYVYSLPWLRQTEQSNIGSGFVGTWDGDVRSATSPVSSPNCCAVVGTTAGFLATTEEGNQELGYYTTGLFFSPDGRSWAPVTMPAGQSGGDFIDEVEDGVLFSGFRGDGDGSNWEPVTVPESISDRVWSRRGSRNGTAGVIDITNYDYSVKAASSTATFTRDGYEITAVTDEQDAVTVTVVEESSGVIVESFEDSWFGEGSPIFLYEGLTFLDADGCQVFIPGEAFDPVSDAYWAAQRTTQDPPEYVLAATTNGINWIVEPLPGQNYGIDDHLVTAINSGIVVIGQADGWISFPIDP